MQSSLILQFCALFPVYISVSTQRYLMASINTRELPFSFIHYKETKKSIKVSVTTFIIHIKQYGEYSPYAFINAEIPERITKPVKDCNYLNFVYKKRDTTINEAHFRKTKEIIHSLYIDSNEYVADFYKGKVHIHLISLFNILTTFPLIKRYKCNTVTFRDKTNSPENIVSPELIEIAQIPIENINIKLSIEAPDSSGHSVRYNWLSYDKRLISVVFNNKVKVNKTIDNAIYNLEVKNSEGIVLINDDKYIYKLVLDLKDNFTNEIKIDIDDSIESTRNRSKVEIMIIFTMVIILYGIYKYFYIETSK